jgi:hypothetical protein
MVAAVIDRLIDLAMIAVGLLVLLTTLAVLELMR